LAIYKFPRGSFANFLNPLDFTLQKHYNARSIYNIACGEVNINYLTDNNGKRQLDALLHSYNISCVL